MQCGVKLHFEIPEFHLKSITVVFYFEVPVSSTNKYSRPIHIYFDQHSQPMIKVLS